LLYRATSKEVASHIDLWPKRGLQMARRSGPASLEHEVVVLRSNQKKLLSALRLLFDLLEAYAPAWYTEEHHEEALAALRLQP